jgi:RNA polymerase sigma factor (sigma-70 family)
MDNSDQRIEQLFNKNSNKLIKVAFTYLKDRHLAEDIVQDVFLKCYLKLDTFRNECTVESWLYKVTINQSIDYLRSSNFKKSFPTECFDFFEHDQPTPENKLIKRQFKEELYKHIHNLSKIYKEVIILFYLDNLSIKEIQELLHINISTVKTRLFRGKMLLRNENFL